MPQKASPRLASSLAAIVVGTREGVETFPDGYFRPYALDGWAGTHRSLGQAGR